MKTYVVKAHTGKYLKNDKKTLKQNKTKTTHEEKRRPGMVFMLHAKGIE